MKVQGVARFLVAITMIITGFSANVSAKNLVDDRYRDAIIVTEVGLEKEGATITFKLNDLDYDVSKGLTVNGYLTKNGGWILGQSPLVYQISNEMFDENGVITKSSAVQFADVDLLEKGGVALFMGTDSLTLELSQCLKYRDVPGAACRLNGQMGAYLYGAFSGDVRITDENVDELLNPGGGDEDDEPEDENEDEKEKEKDDKGGDDDSDGEKNENLGEDEKEGDGKEGEERKEEGETDEDVDESAGKGNDKVGEDDAKKEAKVEVVEDTEEEEVIEGVKKDGRSVLAVAGVGNFTGGIKQAGNIIEDEEEEVIDEGVIGGAQEEGDIVNPPVGSVTGVRFDWVWLFWLTALISAFWLIIAVFKRRKKEEEEKAVAVKDK